MQFPAANTHAGLLERGAAATSAINELSLGASSSPSNGLDSCEGIVHEEGLRPQGPVGEPWFDARGLSVLG